MEIMNIIIWFVIIFTLIGVFIAVVYTFNLDHKADEFCLSKGYDESYVYNNGRVQCLNLSEDGKFLGSELYYIKWWGS